MAAAEPPSHLQVAKRLAVPGQLGPRVPHDPHVQQRVRPALLELQLRRRLAAQAAHRSLQCVEGSKEGQLASATCRAGTVTVTGQQWEVDGTRQGPHSRGGSARLSVSPWWLPACRWATAPSCPSTVGPPRPAAPGRSRPAPCAKGSKGSRREGARRVGPSEGSSWRRPPPHLPASPSPRSPAPPRTHEELNHPPTHTAHLGQAAPPTMRSLRVLSRCFCCCRCSSRPRHTVGTAWRGRRAGGWGGGGRTGHQNRLRHTSPHAMHRPALAGPGSQGAPHARTAVVVTRSASSSL